MKKRVRMKAWDGEVFVNTSTGEPLREGDLGRAVIVYPRGRCLGNSGWLPVRVLATEIPPKAKKKGAKR